LGPERAARAWPCRDVRDAGGTLVLGSDWPIASYDAREVLAFAQLRRRPGSADEPVTPDQALTGLMALEGMTTHAALADGTERTSGRVAVGHRADLTAFVVDPVEAPADELATAPIQLTVSSGRITHRVDAR
ncbi:MAG: amidohydrolase family protein, partial [Actinomycetota bacterium]|nr:amidohydrolase family protein [Actinomycetota bacterium]